jgi:hypothetical protein
MRKIEIVPFGGLKTHFTGGITLEIGPAYTVDDLKSELSKRTYSNAILGASAVSLLESSAVSTDTAIIPAGSPIPKDAKVLFLLPPVSGG